MNQTLFSGFAIFRPAALAVTMADTLTLSRLPKQQATIHEATTMISLNVYALTTYTGTNTHGTPFA